MEDVMGQKQHVTNPHYRLYDLKKYELLRRRAFDETDNSIQLAIDKYLFQDGWEKELAERRRIHGTAGISGAQFMPARKGMKPGRRRAPSNVGRIVGNFRHTCRPNAIESRWIEIHAKGNAQPQLLEARSRCDCGEILIGYFTEKQLGYGPGEQAAKEAKIELAAA